MAVPTLILAALTLACSSGAGAGAPCTSHDQCADRYQCLEQVCVPRCELNSDCGEGYQCSDRGICDLVQSALGDACSSEWECGLGQSCVLNSEDPENEPELGASCQAQGTGGIVGAECSEDSECRNNLCTLGHCSQVCKTKSDCPSNTTCARIPRLLENDSAYFHGCLQETGVLSTTLKMSQPSQRLRVLVPSTASSFALVSTVDDDVHSVGATRVVSPTGDLLFSGSASLDDFINNPIRYVRQRKISTLMVPNSDTVSLETGIYQIDMEASLPPFGPGTIIPEVKVHYKLDASRRLDLHFYFLDLDEHPCREQFDADTLDATTAPLSKKFQDYIGDLRVILEGGAGLSINPSNITYEDIDRADLDGIVGNDLDELFALSSHESGISIFFVRSLSPDGVQAQAGGTPGPPRSPNTSASGIAVSLDTLCYRDWESVARVSAHTIAGHMGLWNNRDPEGTPDPISDTDGSPDNLMFFGEFGGTELSEGQKEVLGRWPGLR